jgi:hypothetical protein
LPYVFWQKITFTYAGRLSNPLSVPVTLEVPFVPVAVSVCVCPDSAEPVNAGTEFEPAGVKAAVELVPVGVKEAEAAVGTPPGHEIDPAGVKFTVPLVPAGVKLAVELVGTPAGQATVPAGVKAAVAFVPAGVIEATPPAGFAVTAEVTSPLVGARAEPPVAVDVITCVPAVAAVVPPCTFHVTVTVCV